MAALQWQRSNGCSLLTQLWLEEQCVVEDCLHRACAALYGHVCCVDPVVHLSSVRSSGQGCLVNARGTSRCQEDAVCSMRPAPTCSKQCAFHEPAVSRQVALQRVDPKNSSCRLRAHAHLSRREFVVFAGACSLAAAPTADADPLPDVRACTSNVQISVSYDKFAKEYDKLDDGVVARSLGFPALRQDIVSIATGDVLETGIGTGVHHTCWSTECGDACAAQLVGAAALSAC